MKEQLIQYVDLLFAGARDCEDIKQEILQNTLDRYDDLLAEGKVPEAAYRMAISGIGDISEILGTANVVTARVAPSRPEEDNLRKKTMRAIAVGLYILCPVPLLILGQGGDALAVIGVCCLLGLVAIATVLIIFGSVKEEEKTKAPEKPLTKSLCSLVWAIGIVVYFVVSYLTRAWHITWAIFLITSAVAELVKAIMDLKEAVNHEN